jgi:predicted small metal-binding protein
VVRADSEEEVVRLAAEHAREVHGVQAIDDAMARQVMAAIADE